MPWGTKNVPNKKERYLVTAISSITGKRYVTIADRCQLYNGHYVWYVFNGGNDKVIAWKKLEKPYEGAVE